MPTVSVCTKKKKIIFPKNFRQLGSLTEQKFHKIHNHIRNDLPFDFPSQLKTNLLINLCFSLPEKDYNWCALWTTRIFRPESAGN